MTKYFEEHERRLAGVVEREVPERAAGLLLHFRVILVPVHRTDDVRSVRLHDASTIRQLLEWRVKTLSRRNGYYQRLFCSRGFAAHIHFEFFAQVFTVLIIPNRGGCVDDLIIMLLTR